MTIGLKPYGNSALAWRGKQVDGKKTIELIGRISSDILTLDKCLLSNVDVKVTLYQNKHSFVLMSPDVDADYCVKITSAKYYVKKYDVSPSLSLAHEKTLKTMNARYHYLRSNMSFFILPKGVSSFTRDNLTFGSKTPRQMLISLVEDTNKNGDYSKNPYIADIHDLSSIRVTRDNIDCYLSPISLVSGDSALAYQSLLSSGSEAMFSDEGLPFDRNGYKNGYAYFLFNFTNDPCPSHLTTISNSSIKIDLEFKKATSENLNLAVYTVSDAHIQITSDRKCFTE